MEELFRMEVEQQTTVLTEALLALERGEEQGGALERLMRAAHALKGAARIVEAGAAVRITHGMEDWFVAAQKGEVAVSPARIDLLLRGVDLLGRVARSPGGPEAEAVEAFLAALLVPEAPGAPAPGSAAREEPPPADEPSPRPRGDASGGERSVRVSAETLDRLLALAAESLVGSRRLGELIGGFAALRRLQRETAGALARPGPGGAGLDPSADVGERFSELRERMAGHFTQLEEFHQRSSVLASRLYQEILASRMRPFADAAYRFPRMVRDLSRELGKEAVLVIAGEETPVDRDILERIEPPLINLLRNAVDHGIEPPEERREHGKPATGTIRLEARHRGGMLVVTLEDDGRGIDPDAIRRAVVRRGYAPAESAAGMSEAELLEFLFLPGFTLRETVTEISGRGVGMDIVQATVREVGGKLSVTTAPGRGMCFELQLPLTLSVLRVILVEVDGEPYAFPISRIGRIRKVRREEVATVEGYPHIDAEGRRIGLVSARQVLGIGGGDPPAEETHVMILGEGATRYGIVLEGIRGERELVVRPLDPKLGRVRNISAAALLPDLAPVLIVDVDDLLRSIEHLVASRQLARAAGAPDEEAGSPRKRVLIVEDSFTVRELERKLLSTRGYEVDVALDGLDGWNAVRSHPYDLVISDVDMPRMDGIELVSRIRQDARLRSIPVIIVSYKDREEDRIRGLDAGADRYLPKGNFQGDSLVGAVVELIGEPDAP
jgi:two-component system sensor histidine kinase and response regulator WspE